MRFRTITEPYFKGADGMILVYDITNRESLYEIDYWDEYEPSDKMTLCDWVHEIKNRASQDIPKILIGNKCDKGTERQVTYEEGKEMASKYGTLFLETSAKTSYNVNEAFMLLIQKIKNEVESGSLHLISSPNKTKTGFKPAE